MEGRGCARQVGLQCQAKGEGGGWGEWVEGPCAPSAPGAGAEAFLGCVSRAINFPRRFRGDIWRYQHAKPGRGRHAALPGAATASSAARGFVSMTGTLKYPPDPGPTPMPQIHFPSPPLIGRHEAERNCDYEAPWVGFAILGSVRPIPGFTTAPAPPHRAPESQTHSRPHQTRFLSALTWRLRLP